MKFKLAMALFTLIPFSAPALAQSAPNMLGKWAGTFNSTVLGTAAHHKHPNKKDNEIYFNNVPFTLVIDRQEGNNFSGSVSSKNHTEIVLGAISPDLQGGVMVDDDGTFSFKFIDPTTIQTCYVQISKPKVASCWIAKKQS